MSPLNSGRNLFRKEEGDTGPRGLFVLFVKKTARACSREIAIIVS